MFVLCFCTGMKSKFKNYECAFLINPIPYKYYLFQPPRSKTVLEEVDDAFLVVKGQFFRGLEKHQNISYKKMNIHHRKKL